MIDKLLSLNAIDRAPGIDSNPEIGTVYLPSVGNHAAHRLETNAAVDSEISFNFIEEDAIFGDNKKKEHLLNSVAKNFEVADEKFLFKSAAGLESGEVIELDDTQVKEEGAPEGDDETNDGRTAGTVAEWYEMKIKDGFFRDNLSTILPVNLTLTIYGISSLVPGDVFRVDYMPKRYTSNVYFQVTRVSHEVNNGSWKTTLTTVMRLRKAVKRAIGSFGDSSGYAKPKIYLSVKCLEDYNLTNYEDLAPFIKELQFVVKQDLSAHTNNIDYIFEFKGKKAGKYKNTQLSNVDNDTAQDMFDDLDGYKYNNKEFHCWVDEETFDLGLFGADLEYKVKFKKNNSYYLITHGDKIVVMPKKMATKKSQNATMMTRFNDFFGLFGRSPRSQADADAGVQPVVPAQCKKCKNVGWSAFGFEEKCLKAGGGQYVKYSGDWFSTPVWGYCYYDTTLVNECLPSPSKCPEGDY